MNRQEFRAAYRMARLVQQFDRDMGFPVSSLGLQVPRAAFFVAMPDKHLGCTLRTHYRTKAFRPRISGPRGALPA